MVMKTVFTNLIFYSVERIFEILKTQKLLPYLPQCDQNTPSGI